MSSLPLLSCYIDGQWRLPGGGLLDVINPATETPCAQVALAGPAEVDLAVAAARRAFDTFCQTSRGQRLDLLSSILAAYGARMADIGDAVSREMGAPQGFARQVQAGIGAAHLAQMIETLKTFVFEEERGSLRLLREPVGVAGLITPWNWPLNQIVCKVAPALAAGCTVVLKPSELAPLSANLFAEVMHAAGVPAGVFNLVHGDGPGVGQAIARHPDIDLVSFTGSTRAGVQVAKLAADTVKRVTQELGGKSANIILPDADLPTAVEQGVRRCFSNSGQSCNAPTRLLVPEDRYEEAAALARAVTETIVVGDPLDAATTLGPLANATQFAKVQRLIEVGVNEGAELVAGGSGRPAGLDRGYYVRPTIFGRVTPSMTVAREEIFGPVLSILTYRSEEEAIALANDTVYGLAAYVQSRDAGRAQAVARRLRAGTVYVNDPAWSPAVPFGGYKQSGNGREYAEFGLAEFIEVKGVVAG
ncbi:MULTISPECIES: aldehyde dehydrogenase family protein [Nitrospirillum]|uniref:aldehyde dehydrogenase (NAD(+)) n=1 Tax=Nitrospirillum amazonense TaxID=28077 RepID=A0A560FVD5_9PROT|nr:aldehyde dehydrogenase family protein [Nitrospirillum amazonense]MEC4594929.1 aldehyde dehydrogenase family protein [Nitrospirillum amazonense]TWB25605.1 aldehyde dehydrogenase (NAD+) [Nitrospirillum amazonense]